MLHRPNTAKGSPGKPAKKKPFKAVSTEGREGVECGRDLCERDVHPKNNGWPAGNQGRSDHDRARMDFAAGG